MGVGVGGCLSVCACVCVCTPVCVCVVPRFSRFLFFTWLNRAALTRLKPVWNDRHGGFKVCGHSLGTARFANYLLFTPSTHRYECSPPANVYNKTAFGYFESRIEYYQTGKKRVTDRQTERQRCIGPMHI